jgi:methylenetetrahydrofolate dehydrogenase (NADP+)/methenyltetrahydrofolate cyclohydrolase
MNQGLLFQKKPGIRPATPLGIMMLLDAYHIPIEGKHVVVVGRSQIVGTPVAKLFLDQNATVTVTHSRTKDLPSFTRQADILVCAIGKPKFITKDMVKKDAIVIDVGINRIDGKLVGDVDFENVEPISSYITPVPKGVGPMTICALAHNLYTLYLKQKENK